MDKRKVVIIGDGAVGSTTAFVLMQKSYVNEIAIIDLNVSRVEGDVLDMVHGLSFTSQKLIKVGTYEDCKDADIIVITAGVAQKEGETRIDLLKRNIGVFSAILTEVKKNLNENAVVLVVTNPVDILSYFTYKFLGIPSNRVIGSGTVLDSSRLKTLISEDISIDPRNIHTFVIGEHGDSEVAAFSVSSIGGIKVSDYYKAKLEKLDEYEIKVKNAAYEIISKKGATFYAIALSVEKIVSSVLNNQHSILTISNFIDNAFHGEIHDVYLSLPVVVGANGVEDKLHLDYSYDEVLRLITSAKKLKKTFEDLGIKD